MAGIWGQFGWKTQDRLQVYLFWDEFWSYLGWTGRIFLKSFWPFHGPNFLSFFNLRCFLHKRNFQVDFLSCKTFGIWLPNMTIFQFWRMFSVSASLKCRPKSKSLRNCFVLLFEKHGGVAEEFHTKRVSKNRHENTDENSNIVFDIFYSLKKV